MVSEKDISGEIVTAQEIIAWIGAIFGSGAAVMVGKFWYDMGVKSRVLEEVGCRVTALAAEITDHKADLAEHKIEAERAFATKAEHAALERRFTEAVEGMRLDFRGMSQRIDRLLETLAGKH